MLDRAAVVKVEGNAPVLVSSLVSAPDFDTWARICDLCGWPQTLVGQPVTTPRQKSRSAK
jgi:hypothetical protein